MARKLAEMATPNGLAFKVNGLPGLFHLSLCPFAMSFRYVGTPSMRIGVLHRSKQCMAPKPAYTS